MRVPDEITKRRRALYYTPPGSTPLSPCKLSQGTKFPKRPLHGLRADQELLGGQGGWKVRGPERIKLTWSGKREVERLPFNFRRS